MTNMQNPFLPRTTPRSIAQPELPMKFHRSAFLYVLLAALLLVLNLPARAQDTEKPPEGINSGNYNVKQTAEFGYRFTNVAGSKAAYNTFVDLHDGSRLLDYSLDMRSLNHAGLLFDNLSFTNFGYGGDPNNVSRLRISKNKWYNFNGNFRRDYTYFDYNLLANPLNPPGATYLNAPAGFTVQVADSPHQTALVRRLSDYNLTLLPQSRFRVRLGYVRDVQDGVAFTSTHEGTDAQLLQNVKSTLNGYQVGLDFKFIPRTSISYDQFLQLFRGDTAAILGPTTFVLANAASSNLGSANIGIPLNPAASQPCAQPFNNGTTGPVGTVYAGCSVNLSYSRTPRPRTTIPVEQLSMQSNYFKNVDFAGRFSYTATDMEDDTFNEVLHGAISRTLQVGSAAGGPGKARRVSATADADVTIHITDKLRFVDMFRFNFFNIPGSWAFANTSLFAQGPLLPNLPGGPPPLNRPDLTKPIGIFDATNCPAPYTALTCPQHSSSSSADLAMGIYMRFLSQNVKYNTAEIEYDFTPRFGGRLGFRYGHRMISDFNALTYNGTGLGEFYFPGSSTAPASNGASVAFRGDCAKVGGVLPATCTAITTGPLAGATEFNGSSGDTARNTDSLNEYSGLLGLWARPSDNVRMNLDMELLSADNTFTRISPRQYQRYKGHITYKPVEWLSMAGAFNILERSNNVTNIFHLEHYRTYGFDVAGDPKPRFGFDAGFDYEDVFSSTDICYALSSTPSTATICPAVAGGSPPIQGISVYKTLGYFAFGDVHIKPVNRLRLYLGYFTSDVNGTTSFLAPNAPPGPLQYVYYRPYAGVDFQIYNGLTWRATYNYHDYRETSVPDLSTPGRNFNANLVTLGLRYSF